MANGIAIIDGVEYTIDSDNSKLLKKLEWGKKKNEETGKWEDVQYDYIPLATILTLMDWLFKKYDFISMPASYCLEEYSVAKKSYVNGKLTDVTDTVRVYEKTVKIVVEYFDGTIREVTWYAQWVASVKQLTSDPSRNGFMQKLAARARKEALKNLGRVFRVLDEDTDDNELISEAIEEASKWTWKLSSSPIKKTDTVDSVLNEQDLEAEYNTYKEELARTYENIFDDEGVFYIQNLVSMITIVKSRDKLEKGSTKLKALERIYNERVKYAQDFNANK